MEQPNIQMFWGLLSQLGGWLNALLAIGVWLVNDPEPVFMFYAAITSGLFWWGLRNVPLWTGVFLLMQPIWQVMWRTQWIHALETSLILLVWQSWRTERITKWTGVLAMLAVWLRPSALIWLGLLWLWDCVRSLDTRRHHWLLAGMVIGCAFTFPQLTQYASGKLAVPRIDWSVLDQIGRHSGWVTTLALFMMIVMGVRQIQHRDWMPGIWMVVGVSLSLFFGVGFDNFPLMFAGFAMLAGSVDLSRWSGSVLVVLTGVLQVLPFLKNMPSGVSWFVHPNTIEETLYDFQRPIRINNALLNPVVVQKTLKDLCIEQKPHCLVVTTGSLFHPHRESTGRLALLTTELSHVRIEKSELWFRRHDQLRFVDAAIVQDCDANGVWPSQFHHFAKEFETHIEAWTVVVS